MGAQPKASYEIRIDGDPELHASVGTVGLEIYAEEVCLSIPDRFGHATMYNFAPADWAQVVELINHGHSAAATA